jgi:hypothetical protein
MCVYVYVYVCWSLEVIVCVGAYCVPKLNFTSDAYISYYR